MSTRHEMSAELPTITAEEFAAQIGPDGMLALEAELALRPPRLELIRIAGHPVLRARIPGPRSIVTELRLHAGGVDHMACTCRVRECIHRPAAFLAWLRSKPTHEGASLSPRWRAVVEELRHALPQRRMEGSVHYVLEEALLPRSGPDGSAGLVTLRLRPLLCRPRKDGRPSAGRSLGYQALAQMAEEGPADDRAVLVLYSQALTAAFPGIMRGRLGGDLLEAARRTGRLHWHAPAHPPLREGPPRMARLEWRLDGAGDYRGRLEVGGAACAIDVEPLCYVDPEEATIGRLEGNLDARRLHTLLAAPPLPALQVAALHESLRGAGVEAAALHLPPPLPIRDAPSTPPQPVLRLETVLDAELGTVDVARLFLRYGATSIEPLTAAGDHVQTLEEEAIVRRPRDTNAESGAMVVLMELGLVPIGALRAGSYLREPHENALVLLDEGGDRIAPATDCWQDFVIEHVPRLIDSGWAVEMAKSFRHRVRRPQRTFVATQAQDDWFECRLGIIVDGEEIDLLPLLVRMFDTGRALTILAMDAEAAAGEERLRLADGREVLVPRSRLQHWLRTLTDLRENADLQNGWIRLSRAHATALARLAEEPRDGADEAPVEWLGADDLLALGQRLRRIDAIPKVRMPRSLKVKLRPYQRDGVAWLQFLREHGFGGALADDMGLGKTVQALAHFLIEKEAGRATRPHLVVAPTSLLWNWQREAGRFTPTLRVLVWHGDRPNVGTATVPFAGQDLVITSYGVLLRDAELFASQEFHIALLDEAQAIKNPTTRMAHAARALRANQKLCMTGTPLENHLGELWSQFAFAMPGFLGNRAQFARRYRNPIERGSGVHAQTARDELRRRLAPFLMRRTKEQVAKELPAKTEVVRYVELEDAQRELYETVRASVAANVARAMAEQGLERSQIAFLDALLKLRQVCCDPRLLQRPSAEAAPSAKLEALCELLEELVAEGRRVLVFSQFATMLALIEDMLQAYGIGCQKLTGQTRARQTLVDRFQAGEVPVFLISLKAGGVGLNLTAADTVLHYDPWWNPAAEAQATDRAHRIGQQKPVFVYKLLVRGTIEEKIHDLQTRKKALADAILGGGEGRIARWTKADVDFLLGS